MEENEQKEKKEKKLKEQVEELICRITEAGIDESNVKILSELVDIHKDLCNEEYWKKKEEVYDMRYGNYGRDEYGARMRDSRGRYMDGGSYGRRGRYRGHDMLDDMKEAYRDYMEGAEYGNYGTSESMQKIEIMADSLMDFVEHLKEEAKTPEERQLIDRKLKELGRM